MSLQLDLPRQIKQPSLVESAPAEPKPVPKLKPRPVRPLKMIDETRWKEYRFDYSGLY